MKIFGGAVAPAADARPAAWVPPRLGAFGTVGGLVPHGFEQYVLVTHQTLTDAPAWYASQELLDTLASVAARHTSTPEAAWFAIWEGYGWESATTTLYRSGHRTPGAALAMARERRRSREAERRGEQLRLELLAVPKFDLPHRRYYVLAGSVASAARIESPDGIGHQPPDLWWPDDHAWFIATDTDLAWSYLGGTRALASDLLAALHGQATLVDWSASNATFSA